MKPSIIPSGSEVLREAIIVLAGAGLAALVLAMVPAYRDWIKKQWSGSDDNAA